MTVAWAPPLRFPPLPERQRDAPGQFAVERSARARNPERQRVEPASSCGRSTSPARCRRGRWSATIGPVGVVRQNADKRTRAQVHGDQVHFIAACSMVTAPLTTLSPEATPVTVEPFLRHCAVNCAVIVTPHDASGDTGQNCDRGIFAGNCEFGLSMANSRLCCKHPLRCCDSGRIPVPTWFHPAAEHTVALNRSTRREVRTFQAAPSHTRHAAIGV
jgi:hypothetical protein